jgi:hypothetical protein
MLISCTRSEQSCEIFRFQASSCGYLVRVAPDPNHQSDAAVQRMVKTSTTTFEF